MGNDPGGRTFSEHEVALILRTAAELQERGVPGSRSGRLSQGQLEQVASEVGMDPAVIRRAIREVDARGQDKPGSRLLGGPAAFTIEREVEGEVPISAFESVLDTVRRHTGQLGEVSTIGRLFGWRGPLGGAKAEVSLTPADGRTTVRVRVALDQVAIGSYAGGGIGLGVTGAFFTFAALTNPLGWVAAWIAGGVMASGVLAGRFHFSRSANRYHEQAAGLADAIADQLSLAPPQPEAHVRQDRQHLPP